MLNMRKPPRVRMPLFSLFATIVITSSALADNCKLVVASRTNLKEGQVLALEYTHRFKGVELLKSKNGLFAISLGTLPFQGGSDVSQFIEKYDLPYDTFCMRMDSVVRNIDFEQLQSQPKVIAPTENAFGLKSCPYGYQADSYLPTSCTEIILPQNAELNQYGSNWVCSSGYLRNGNRCDFIKVPSNAHLTSNTALFPNAKGWECDQGFKEVLNECEKIFVPDNATLSIFGNSYECNTGFVDIGNQCRPMTREELLDELETKTQLVSYLLFKGSGKTCSEIEDLCEETCDDEFTSYSSPTKRECEKVCKEIDDKC